ncbi:MULTISPECIES: ACT domain-containing protein [Streptomyces]|uniref:ACT domain-containing protein n=1 Tax=Streptomyces TaxID=1883 RepID=UPI002F92B3D8
MPGEKDLRTLLASMSPQLNGGEYVFAPARRARRRRVSARRHGPGRGRADPGTAPCGLRPLGLAHDHVAAWTPCTCSPPRTWWA